MCGIIPIMIHTSEPVFAVSDVVQAVRFYCDVLGFGGEWFWEDPPTFGGVREDHISVMFCLQPRIQPHVEGLMHFFRVDDVRGMYNKHKAAGAPIVSDIENKPWGLCEYTVRDPNGYHLRFAGVEEYVRKPDAITQMPPHIRIEKRTPGIEDYERLSVSVGWNRNRETMKTALQQSLFCVVAIDTRSNTVVGMVRVCGDGRNYTFWDVIVVPEYQQQKIGSAMMEQALAELRKIGPKGAFVGLFTPKPGFYEQLGFQRGIGMHLGL